MTNISVFVISLWLLCGALVRADVLVFENNDRLSGTFVGEENGVIRFNSDLLGPVAVDAKKARVEKSREKPSASAKAALPSEFKAMDVRSAAKSPSNALNAQRVGWIRRLEFGYTAQSGRTEKSDLALRFELGRRGRSSETRLLARYLYGETQDVRSADSANADLRLRRNMSSVLFAQSTTRYNRDLVKRLEHEGEQGFGLGRNLVEREDIVLAIGAGTAARFRDPVGSAGSWDYLVDAFQDITYAINDRLSVSEDFSVVVAPANSDDYKLKLNAALTSKITDTLAVSMRYEMEYDRAVQEDTRESQRVVTAIGYLF